MLKEYEGRDFIPPNARDGADVSLRRARKEEERFLSSQADAFAGANAEEKSRPAPFEMTVPHSKEMMAT
jgi:hypothetical protein